MTGCVEVQDLGTVAILMRPKLSPGRRERSLRIETLASALTETLAHWFGVDFVDVDFPFGVLVEEIVVVTNVDLRPADLEELIGSVEVDDDLCVAAAEADIRRPEAPPEVGCSGLPTTAPGGSETAAVFLDLLRKAHFE
jgi:hypothetical protein